MRHRLVAVIGVFGFAAVAAACGGRSATVPSGAPPAAADHGKARATFTILVPKAAAKTAGARAPRYVSPATTQLAIDVEQSGSPVSGYPTTVGLTPTSTGCSSTLAGTECQLTIGLAPGSYTATLSAEDAGGTALSGATAVPFTVVAGAANQVALTLNGVPHQITVAPGAYAVHGSQNEGLVLYGAAAQKILVNALDADGNTIVGPGSPSYAATVVAGSGWTAATPAPTTPNTFTISPPGTNAAFAQIAVTASFSDTTCSSSGAVCTASFEIKNDIQTLYVLDHGTPAVAGYTLPVTTGVAPSIPAFNGGQFTNGWALAVNAVGDVFVADPSLAGQPAGTENVYEYAPTGTLVGTVATYTWNARSLAVDANANLYAADFPTPNASGTPDPDFLVEIPAPYIFYPSATYFLDDMGSAVTSPGVGVAVDPNGNVWWETENAIYEYNPNAGTPVNPPAASAQASVNTDGPPFAVDALSNVYYADTGRNVKKLTPPSYSSASTFSAASSPGAEPMAIAFDAAADVFVALCSACGGGGSSAVLEYSSAGSLLATITTGVNDPAALAIDGAGNLYVANAPNLYASGTDTVTVYAPPFSNASTPTATLNDSSVSTPLALAITP